MSDFKTDRRQLLDLLVDGELSESERGELLAWCEREPDGWRRCALAFLEAQSWSTVLGDLTDAPPQSAAAAPFASESQANMQPRISPVVRRQRFWHVRPVGTMLAMAASVVLAFTLGLWVRDAGKPGPFPVARQPALELAAAGERRQTARVGLGRPEQGVADPVRLAADETQVPVMDDGQPDGGWLRMQPPAMPDEVRQALERLGHRVQQERRLVPFHLDDGRRGFVPVDQVEVRPVDHQPYQ